LFRSVVDEQISRLEELLGVHEEIGGDEAAELADRASFDATASFERLRRFQSAKSRELRQTLDALAKLRKTPPARPLGSGLGTLESQSADSRFQQENGDGQITNGEGQMANGEEQMTNGEGPTTHDQGTMTKDQGRGTNDKGPGGKAGVTISSDNPLTTLLIRRLVELALEKKRSTKPAPVKISSGRAGDARREAEKGTNEAKSQLTQIELSEGLQSHSAATNEAKRSQFRCGEEAISIDRDRRPGETRHASPRRGSNPVDERDL
jgi:hypothetical protein